MKNKISDLRDILFAQLEKLSEDDCDLEKEIKRSQTLIDVATVMIDSGRAENEFLKIVESSDGIIDSEFFQPEKKKTISIATEQRKKTAAIAQDGLKDM